MANVELPSVNPSLGDISQSGVDQLRSLVKQLHNASVMQTEELLYILNNLDTRNVNEIDGDILVTGTITAAKMNVQKLSAIAADLGAITAGVIDSVEIYGSYIATSRDEFPKVEMSPEGFKAYGPAGGESLTLGQADDGGALLFKDNGSPRGSIYGDTEGLHVGNMASVHIKSTDDKTYLDGAVSFENATEVSGLRIWNVQDLQQQLAEINGDILQNMIINASFDNSTRNLKLFSKTRTVATVFIPASAPE
ncbi:hypothetical protein H7K28_06715 [Paenibacillus polymyxa]|jgi:hypothetical protein|uniref:hypothetical protein n=1 Tax=Paenibacillus polymyxa TaxID=1406 RepID=UPI001580193E|nr:hypothetical protein [Paenibacillus polymyxa]MBY0020723.1 hypothetical protein [Paenibacillus polymyxa]MBY0059027.1 hypothetical protein [Paenibacillus polymyxa]MBY0069614.1 hypothetical protein [Paenibacillus polymyxa]MBY0078856.1 hypothetical protein [Paenibacillus polymyxa]MBZ6441870.1 hypothetical protein [Paenibacillus polymyxa]